MISTRPRKSPETMIMRHYSNNNNTKIWFKLLRLFIRCIKYRIQDMLARTTFLGAAAQHNQLCDTALYRLSYVCMYVLSYSKSLYNLYILQIYLSNIKSLKLKYMDFCFIFFKSRLCFYINLDFLQFLFYICQNIHFKDILIKYEIFYIKFSVCPLLYIFYSAPMDDSSLFWFQWFCIEQAMFSCILLRSKYEIK